MTSDSNANSANKRLPLMLSDAAFGESDRVEMCHMASTESSLGITSCDRVYRSMSTCHSGQVAHHACESSWLGPIQVEGLWDLIDADLESQWHLAGVDQSPFFYPI